MNLECSPFGCVVALIGDISFIMNDLQKLTTTSLCDRQFTVYGTLYEPLFKAKDVADMLELTNWREFIQRVDEDERCKLNLPRQGKTWFLTEQGLYEVLMQSRKPIAKQFKSGVKKILKEIRVTGSYNKNHLTDIEKITEALLISQRLIDELKSENQNLKSQLRLLRTPTARNRMKAAADNNSVEEFLNYIGIQPASNGNGKWVSMHELMDSYDDFCKSKNKASTNSKRIGRTLRSKGYERQHKWDGSWYLIAIKMI